MNTQPPVARVVLLGASNLRLVSAKLIATARTALGGPLEVFIASGFGRSYGLRSAIPWRSLPGILECGLWQSLEEPSTLPTFAFVTDVGNDLVYSRTPEQLMQWVTTCVDRLQRCEAQMVFTSLPLHSIHGLSIGRYKIFQRIFFPDCNLSVETLRLRAEETNKRLLQLTKERDCHTIEVPGSWYGFDPIHYHRRHYGELSKRIAAAWAGSPVEQKCRNLPWKKRFAFERATPQQWWSRGRERATEQPAVVLEEGSRLFLY